MLKKFEDLETRIKAIGSTVDGYLPKNQDRRVNSLIEISLRLIAEIKQGQILSQEDGAV